MIQRSWISTALLVLAIACSDDAEPGAGAGAGASAGGNARDGGDRESDAGVPDSDGGASGSTAPTPDAGAELPADVLDLTAWKLTLPTGDEGSPTEIVQPALSAFELDPYFHIDDAGEGVVFRAHAGGVTTDGSTYPRCELREMAGDGSEMAAWSTTAGVHTMTITQAITHLPEAKPDVVAGQVHDAEDDVVMIRLEGTYLFVEGGGEDLGTLDASYSLGTRFTVRIEAEAGHIRVYHEDLATPAVDVERDSDGCYFKAGAYTQSNPEHGDDPHAYGEVVIYDLTVTHTP